jgi:hypothetical protein
MTPERIAILRKHLAQLEAERADRVRRGAPVPVWFDHMLDKRRAQLRAAEQPERIATLRQMQRNNRINLVAIAVAIACVVAMIIVKVVRP